MREGPEGTVVYWEHNAGRICTGCARKGARGAHAVHIDRQEASDDAYWCSRCARALGNRLSARGLDAVIRTARACDPEQPECAERANALVRAYAGHIVESTTVDLLLTQDAGTVCRSEPDTQRLLASDLNDCACRGNASGATAHVVDRYRIVAAPDIRSGLEGMGYDPDDLGDHARNIERAIWEMAWQSESDREVEGDEEAERRRLQVDLRLVWDTGECERARALVHRAWRATHGSGASLAALALAKNGSDVWTGQALRTEDARSSLRGGWGMDVEEDEMDEVELSSEVPARVAEAIEHACGATGAQVAELRTMHRPYESWVWAELELGPA